MRLNIFPQNLRSELVVTREVKNITVPICRRSTWLKPRKMFPCFRSHTGWSQANCIRVAGHTGSSKKGAMLRIPRRDVSRVQTKQSEYLQHVRRQSLWISSTSKKMTTRATIFFCGRSIPKYKLTHFFEEPWKKHAGRKQSSNKEFYINDTVCLWTCHIKVCSDLLDIGF